MGITFTRVDTVASVDEIKGSQLKQMADAFNDRLRSGIADPTYRIQHYFLSAWRQIRTGAGSVIPANSEFLESFMHVAPALGNYPEPFFNGEGGMNPANVFIQFVAGLPNGLKQDETRINIDVSTPSTLRGKWELAKRQRGYYDPSTEDRDAPATQAADAYRTIIGSNIHGKAYGGFSAESEFGSVLQKTDGRPLDRVGTNGFITEFRGSTAQRTPSGLDDIESISFDFQDFLTKQYQLNPAKGSGGVGVYPKFEATGSTISAGAIGGSHAITNGFVLAGALIETEGLTNTIEVAIKHGGETLRQVTLSPDSQESLQIFDLITANTVTVELLNEATFENSNGRLTIECSELEAGKPQVEDAYLLMRLATTTGNAASGSTDTIGISYALAKQVSDNYKDSGCILGKQIPTQAQFGTNDNPIWDAARRRTRQWIRVITRESLLGYSATANKSTLYFKRHKLVDGEQVDLWDGIADAITDTPAQGEYSNEWLTFFQFKGFKNSESSAWKPSNYSDYWSMSERCQFAGGALENGENSQYKSHFQSSIAPEAPTGYRYVGTTNPTNFLNNEERTRFYKSCQIYQPDYEVESVTSTNIGGVDAVAVQYKSRFQRTSDAPTSVAFDIGTWDLDQVDNDEYRTDENAIMSYILHAQLGRGFPSLKPGDTATDSNASPLWSPGDTDATIYPHFFFTKLIPFAGTGSDGVYENADARPVIDQLQQCEMYLRAMCEGYIDGPGTVRFECDFNGLSLYDYTFENLCQEANSLSGISFLPRSLRPEDPNAYGPLPNTLMYAEVFNQLARAINLLDKARVIVPFKLECKEYFFQGLKEVSPDWSDGSCVTTPSPLKAVWTGTAAQANTLTAETDWQECSLNNQGFYVAQSDVETNFDQDDCGGDFQILTTARVTEFRFSPADPQIANAISPDILELLEGGQGGFLGYLNTQETTYELTEETTSGASYDCNGTKLFDSGTGYSAVLSTDDTTTCGLVTSGALDPGNPGESGHFIVRDNATDFCLGGFGRVSTLTADPSNTSFFVEVPLT